MMDGNKEARKSSNREESNSNNAVDTEKGGTDAKKSGSRISQLYHEVVLSGFDKDKTVGFTDASLRSTWKAAFKKFWLTTLLLCVMVLALLSIYWGALQHLDKNSPSLTVWVVDMDGQIAPYEGNGIIPMIGPMVSKALNLKNTEPRPHLGYILKNAADFNNDPKLVWDGVYHEHAWVAIIVNANATTLLTQALRTGNATYDPKGALQLVWIEARDETTYAEYVMPEIYMDLEMIVSQFGQMWAQQSLQMLNTTEALTAAQAVPQAINPGIGYSAYNLRPFVPPPALPSVTVGLIYLIIISFFTFAFYMPIHQTLISTDEHKPLHYGQWIIYRLVVTIIGYFFLSFFYSLTSMAFRVPFSRQSASSTETAMSSHYGRGTFVVYWMLNWVGTMALGFPSENMGMLLGFPYSSLWLIFWVISNVATSFYQIPLEPGFYTYGYAWPLHNVVEATRTIIFDIHSRLGLNFGVLFAWIAINLAFFPICCFIFRGVTLHSKKKEQEQKRKKEEKKEGDNKTK